VVLVRPPFEEPNVPLFFDVLYEDDDVLALDKPAGLPVHPSATYHKNTLTYLLKQRFGENAPQIAHRLDRETSGLLLCGRTPAAGKAPAKPSAEQRYRMIQSAAYFLAEKDGFQGSATHYWTVAEREIAAQLGEPESEG